MHTFFSSDKDKIASVLLNRMSFEKRLSGSPIKKISLLNNSQITKTSGIKESKRTRLVSNALSSLDSSIKNSKVKEKENVDVSNTLTRSPSLIRKKTISYRTSANDSSPLLNVKNNRKRIVRINTSSSSSSSDSSYICSSSYSSDESNVKENVNILNRSSNIR